MRLGVGHPGEKARVTGYVLRDFSKAEKQWVSQTIEAVAKAIPLLLKGDGPAFANQVGLLTQQNKPKNLKDGIVSPYGLKKEK